MVHIIHVGLILKLCRQPCFDVDSLSPVIMELLSALPYCSGSPSLQSLVPQEPDNPVPTLKTLNQSISYDEEHEVLQTGCIYLAILPCCQSLIVNSQRWWFGIRLSDVRGRPSLHKSVRESHQRMLVSGNGHATLVIALEFPYKTSSVWMVFWYPSGWQGLPPQPGPTSKSGRF